MDNNKSKEATPSWKGCIIFGVINILLVLLCTQLGKMVLSNSVILLIVAGFVFSIQCIREDWKAEFKASAVGCIIGLVLHCGAAILYVVNILNVAIYIVNDVANLIAIFR